MGKGVQVTYEMAGSTTYFIQNGTRQEDGDKHFLKGNDECKRYEATVY